MNRSKHSTPIKSPKREQKPCENVEEEFCKRTLALVTSYYETLPMFEILNFPPVENATVQPEKKCAFNSSIVDLRMKRALENHKKAIQQYSENYVNTIEQFSTKLKSASNSLDDVFHNEPVDRPPKPLYIMNEEKDKLAEKQIKRRFMRSLNILKMEPKMKERLQESERKGKERAAWRYNRLRQAIKQAETPKSKAQ